MKKSLSIAAIIIGLAFSANCHVFRIKSPSAGTRMQNVETHAGCGITHRVSTANSTICDGGPVSAINVHSLGGCVYMDIAYRVEFTCADGKKQVSYANPVEAERLRRMSEESAPEQCAPRSQSLAN